MIDRSAQADIRVGSTPQRTIHVSAAERRAAASARHWLGLGVITVAAIIADQVTKAVVRSSLAVDDSVHLVGPLSLRHIWNTGIAFGLFSRAIIGVIVLTVLALLWILFFFARSGARHPALVPALGLLAGGSITNLVDRIRLGHVTDFIDFHYWPTFNLADSFITAGVALLVLVALLSDRRRDLPARIGQGAGAPPA